jgi:hypothetical protein
MNVIATLLPPGLGDDRIAALGNRLPSWLRDPHAGQSIHEHVHRPEGAQHVSPGQSAAPPWEHGPHRDSSP